MDLPLPDLMPNEPWPDAGDEVSNESAGQEGDNDDEFDGRDPSIPRYFRSDYEYDPFD